MTTALFGCSQKNFSSAGPVASELWSRVSSEMHFWRGNYWNLQLLSPAQKKVDKIKFILKSK